ncbi:uncharacterized protein LOC130891177 [Diorhabda carinulata]|uniref:uncharacterized protein LOC130891177 n=1 Tax=Diorhabda carinulata TaxID=1163345 RepID=UPI0025A0D13B|nr:uncharacterized protein LOC130891177 [Diorhabda carinulata]
MFKYIYISIAIVPFSILCQNFEEAWHSYQSSIFNGNREELIISNVTAQTILSLKSNVVTWRSQNIGSICYSVGLADTGLTILMSYLNTNKSGFNTTTNFIPTSYKPRDVVLFHNRRNMKSECIILISFFGLNKIKWMKIVDMFVEEDFWSWTLDDPVEHINYFKIATRNILFVTTNSSDAFLYEFNINNARLEKWLIQNIQLESPVSLSTFNSFKFTSFLSILQPGQVLIYKYHLEKFRLQSKLQSMGVNQITSFNIGFKSFLAINGNSAGIYELFENTIIRHTIGNSNLNGITYWLSIPIQTYRDEVLLLAQKCIDHATHVNNEVDVFIYNGNKFEEHEDIPCFLFEESTNRLTCLAHNKGILGSSYIVIEDVVALLIPAFNNSSIIFIIHFGLKEVSNPLEKDLLDLLRLKNSLEASIEMTAKKDVNTSYPSISYSTGKDKLPIELNQSKTNISEYMDQLNNSEDEIAELLSKIDKLNIDENKQDFKNIIINGRVKFEGDVILDEIETENIDGQETSLAFSDVVRRNNITSKVKNKIFNDTLMVEDLFSSTINRLKSNDITFADDAGIILNGNIKFEKPVELVNVHLRSNQINNIVFGDEIIEMGKNHEGSLAFENINIKDNMRAAKINNVYLEKNLKTRSNPSRETDFDSFPDIHISHNITVNYINEENFTEFMQSICLTNLKCTIPGTLKISGKIAATEIITNYLNDLKFPEVYISPNSISEVNITGNKHFTTLETDEITVVGSVNQVDTRTVITTSTEQHLGNKTLKNCGITDELEVYGKIVGNLVQQFPPNLQLPDVDEIKSNALFKNLEIRGNIFIKNNFNQEDYYSSLQDILYRDDVNATIFSSKEFLKGLKTSTLYIDSDSINDVKINSIITQNTDQQLNYNVLNGSVSIQKLDVHGLYENMNITKLDTFTKLKTNQFIDSSIEFDEIEAANLEIFKTLNNLSLNEYLYVTDGGYIDQVVTFDKIGAGNITIKGEVIGNVTKFDLEQLSENYLSISRNQSLKFDMNISESRLDSLSFTKINGRKNEAILNDEDLIEKLIEKLNCGNLSVTNLIALDSIEFEKVNEKLADFFMPINLFDHLNNTNVTELTFENDIYVPAIEIFELSFVEWDNYVKQIVFKNETHIAFSGNKTFQSGINVMKLIETKRLNNIFLEYILTKEYNQTIMGPIQIEGDVNLNRVVVNENMNDVPVPVVLEYILVSNGNYYLKSDVIFRRLPYIESLKIFGKINNKDILEVFKDMAFRNKDITFRNDTIFKERVSIAGNLAIKNHFNYIKFNDVVSNIVLTSMDTDINSKVVFSKTVLVQEKLTVDENVGAHTIGGFNVSNWIDRGISLDKGLIRDHYIFEHVYINDNLITDFVSGIDMKRLVPLKTNQTIDKMEFIKLKLLKDIFVGKTINNLYLPEEMSRTIMKNSLQEIYTKTVFNNIILVRQNLNVSLVNNKNTSKIVTTHTDQILTSDYNFNSKTVSESNITIDGFINEVNLVKWKTTSLKIDSRETQQICNDWNLNNLTFFDDVQELWTINGLNLTRISIDVEDRKNKKSQFEDTILEDYTNICKDVTFLYGKAKSQIYKLKYFEEFQRFSFPSKIKLVHDFIYNSFHYLLVNHENCMTDIYVFNGTRFIPLFTNVTSGQFEQIVSVVDEDVLFLVTRGNHKNKCDSIEGVNIWIFNNEGLELMYNMENQDIIQESVVPSTFYTIGRRGVIEHKIRKNSTGPIRYREWEVFDGDAAFVPRGLKTGLAIRTGKDLIFLNRNQPIIQDTSAFSEAVIKGSIKRVHNTYIPGKNGGDIAVLNVGIKSAKKELLAVASHEKSIVRDSLDVIEIYDNPLTGEVFGKVLTYKPSSLLTIELGQGETLLAFLENKQMAHFYEYKGTEGFVRRISVKLEASDLFKMDLSNNKQLHSKKIVGVIHQNRMRLLIAVMDGNQISDNLHCEL